MDYFLFKSISCLICKAEHLNEYFLSFKVIVKAKAIKSATEMPRRHTLSEQHLQSSGFYNLSAPYSPPVIVESQVLELY